MRSRSIKIRDAVRDFSEFFPVTLLIIHLKKNHLLLLLWFVLFAFTGKILATKYGVPYLFLTPEYMGVSGFFAYFFVGVSIGGFIMAFHAYTYVLYGTRFPFIVTVARPFLKFSMNNSILPLLYLLFYTGMSAYEQSKSVYLDGEWFPIIQNLIGFYGGVFFFVTTSIFYFFRTNKHVDNIGADARAVHTTTLLKEERITKRLKKNHYDVKSYLTDWKTIKFTRPYEHYNTELVERIFSQNKVNATVFEVLMIFTFIVLGIFRDTAAFKFPAALSIVLLLTVTLMLVSAFYSWFKAWTVTVLAAIVILLSLGSKSIDFLQYENYAYGLDYETKADYSNRNLEELQLNRGKVYKDREHFEGILNRWKAKQQDKRPKLVLVTSSGGGLRSALWSYEVLAMLDSLSQGGFYKKTNMMTGASGGMLGNMYYRELHRSQKINQNDQNYLAFQDAIASDLLNQVAFSIATNDIFVRLSNYKYAGQSYPKDRGTALEMELTENTGFWEEDNLHDYYSEEYNADIPVGIMAPVIVNDARRLIISSQPISFLTKRMEWGKLEAIEAVEFRSLFKKQNADSLKFASALRMNASFPYIMPLVSLPAQPRMEVMDAGLRDNYGMITMLRYIQELKEWIDLNTSGVVILQIRDSEKEKEEPRSEYLSLSDKLTKPLDALYSNFPRIQDYQSDWAYHSVRDELIQGLDIYEIVLPQSSESRISLSWHLTEKEKQHIVEAVRSEPIVEILKKVLDATE